MRSAGDGEQGQDPLAFLAGGGEMGPRIRAFDWTGTPLGPIEGWPPSLRSALSICLNASFPIALYWGSDLRVLYNDDWSPILGAKHPWALGRPAREAWPEIWDIIEPLFAHVVNTGEATRRRDQLLPMHRHGFTEECYFDYTFSPIRGETGQVAGIFNAVIETTTRVIGERRLRTLRELAAWKTGEARSAEEACQTAAAILSENPLDLPFTLLYLLNGDGRQATRVGLTGLSEDSPACPAIINLEEPTSPWPFHQVAATGKAVEVRDLTERLAPLPGGAWPEAPRGAVVLPMVKPGQSQLAGFVVAGLSPRLAFNDEYRGFLDLLAGHVAAAVANARAHEEERRRAEALAELDRAKTAFFSNVSHEFRTPLTLMLAPVEELLSRSHTDLSPAAKGHLEIVHRNGLRLLRLVNSLLDFSRIEAGRVRAMFEATDLAAFTAELASVFRSACERAGLRLVVDCPRLPEPVFVDREMWEKIVLNLLSNAFKFTFTGAIAVSLRHIDPTQAPTAGERERDTRGRVQLRVRDTGTGIPAEEMPHLFERFHRPHNARGRTHEGSGIGLALVQELVKLHGGSVTAESVEGQGTTFLVAMPLGSSHLPPEQIGGGRSLASTATGAVPYVEEALRWLPDDDQADQQGREEPPARYETLPVPYRETSTREEDKRPWVLVADDNADMRQYIIRLLGERHQVEAVADGEAALRAVRERCPDLILTDVMMPRLDGFGLLRELRADPRTRSLPVIMLSARAGEESRVDGMEAGADDYLVKPFSARELLARVSAHLQMARIRREASASLQQSEQRLRLALIAARMVAWEWQVAEDHFILSDNAADVLGVSKVDSLEQGFALIHPHDVDAVRAMITRAMEEGGDFLMHFRIIRPDNRATVWLEDRGYAVVEAPGKAVRLVGVLLDVTERKRAEEVLRESDRRKDEFLSILSHELRNPLAPLRNGLQVIKLARDNAATVEQARAMMERQLGQMVRLIDDLLDLSRISQGKIELRKEQILLASIVQQAVETTRPLIDANGHALTIHLPTQSLCVNADALRLAQVFANLLNNAAKYTPPGGQITLTVERQGDAAVLSVRDTGVGIPPPMLPRVFDMFTQVDRTLERSQGGLGIGLSLVKRLVEMHGGSAEAFSDGLGQGSTFVVRLPLSRSPVENRSVESGDQPRPTTGRRILVVDDNQDSATTLAMMLTIMGNETQTAHDGLEALQVAAAFVPDVVLLDIGMPKLNGYDAARCIREQPWGKKVVLVAVTGWGQDEDRHRSMQAGFDHHLIKPLDPAVLDKLLEGVPPAAAR